MPQPSEADIINNMFTGTSPNIHVGGWETEVFPLNQEMRNAVVFNCKERGRGKRAIPPVFMGSPHR
jgi:hypothetical protein